jgi:signal transduction histidine kinase
MKRRTPTLAGRVAAVQTTVTLSALATVAAITAVAVTILLSKRTDHHLQDVATRVVSVLDRLPPETTDPHWIAFEVEEQRASGTRIEVRDAAGALRAAVGELFGLPDRQTGCADYGVVRACGAQSARFSVVVATPRAADQDARRSLIFALVGVTMMAGAIVTIVSRAVTRRALQPLAGLASRIAAVEPGAGARAAVNDGLVEIDALAVRFDDLLLRFEDALGREQRLTAQASHELRTPLTLARAEIEGLAAPGGGPDAVMRALAAIDRLAELVDALLWFAKGQARLDDGTMEIVNIADVVRAQIGERSGAARDAIAVGHLPDEALVRGDERLLGRITANLIDNALKYGAGASVAIDARARDQRLEVTVSNAGHIAPEVEARLFEPFFRGHGGAATAIVGFGLGLPFARAVARAHGGDVSLDPVAGDHTTFRLTLPLVAWNETPERDSGT